MKRLIKLFTILLVLGQIYSISTHAQSASRSTTGSAARKGSPVRTAPLASFDRFPEGQPRSVSLCIEDEDLRQITPREQAEQARDWLLRTIVSSIGLSPARIDEILYDLPVARYGYLKGVSKLDYGPRRSRYVDDQHVLALAPVETPEQRAYDLAHIADMHRNDTGEIPPIIEVFEYTVDLQKRIASITRREETRGRDLFTPQYGYFEDRVKSRQDLERFLSRIDDLTFARMNADGLTLGGRKIQGYRGISLENVATLWMAGRERKGQRNQAISSASNKEEAFNRRWEQTAREFEVRWAAKLRFAQYEPGQRDLGLLTPEQQKEFDREMEELLARKRSEQQQFEKELSHDLQKVASLTGIGFSLDPHYDYKGLAEYFKIGIKPRLEDLKTSNSAVRAKSIDAAEKGISVNDEIPLLRLIDDLHRSESYLESQLAFQLKKDILQYRFQTARYDGEPLKRTEVGMVLFYTDLLAKLWALDYKDSSPRHRIEDFKPYPELQVSPVFEPELLELPSTRLWFGPQIKGYQAADKGKALVFARNATRIYAASSSPLAPGREGEANAESAAFLGWWDDHYEEIAQFEPQYERLNEIMKWSLLIGWLNNNQNSESLSFLETVKVDRSFWFPNWVRQHPELRFKNRDQIRFHPEGYKGTETEAMPILSSRKYFSSGRERYIAGGASLGDELVFQRRGSFPSYKQIKKWLIRSDLDAERSVQAGALKVIDGPDYKFAQPAPNRSSLTATPRTAERIRDKFAQLLGLQKFVRSTVRAQNSISTSARVNGTGVARLDIAPAGNGFKVGFKSLDVDQAHRLARRVSRSPDPIRALQTDWDIESVIKSPDEDFYFVKARSMEKWLKIGFQKPGKAGAGWQSSVGDLARDSLQVNLSWVDEAKVKTTISQSGFISISKSLEGDVETAAVYAGGVPKEGLRSVEIADGTSTIAGKLDPEEQVVYFRYSQTRGNLRGFGKLLSGEDLTNLQRLSDSRADGIIGYAPHSPTIPRQKLASVDTLLGKGKYKDAINVLDEMKASYGETEDLMLRRGLAEIGEGESRAGLATLSPLFKDPERAILQLDELNVRLAQFDRGADNAILSVRVGRDGKSDIVLRMSQELRDEPLGVEEIDAYKASVYVQDDPSLNKLDWNASINKSLHQVISGDLGTVIKAPRGSIRDYSPTVIYDSSIRGGSGSGGFRFKGINLAEKPGPRKVRFTPRGPIYVCVDNDDKDKDREKKKGSDKDEDCIWIVLRKAS